MSHNANRFWALIAAAVLALSAPAVMADEEESSVSIDVSIGAAGNADGVDRPTHRPFNIHFGAGFNVGLGDELNDGEFGDLGGQGLIGLDIVMAEPLAFSILGGFNAFSSTDDYDGLRSMFIGAGLHLRLFADKNGALFDDGTAAGNLWIDAHIDYVAHLFEDHGGYNIGLGYEFALWKDVNFGPYVRFQHVAWGEGQLYKVLSFGVQISLGGSTGPDDKDGDGILDPNDKCPLDPEDMDGFKDTDGCPDTDNDEDGILDVDDQCPDVAGIAANNGCPDDDVDGDGIKNDVDQCPEEAEDKDEFEDEDGCPDPDNDQDGILDPDDKCPLEPEDVDGFEDEDGCPDPDNDQDGILDVDDQCPNEAESMNGVDDEDGCPDLVRIVGDQIKILQKVYFATGKAKILDKSHALLKEVAMVIKAKPDIKVRVEGHTDDVGKDKKNMRLSQRRADSVRKFLEDEGVPDSQLTAEGKGETTPIADNKTKEGKAENRRVEFHIISAPKPAPEAVPAVAPEAVPAVAPEAVPEAAPEAAPEAPAPPPAEPAAAK